MVQEGWITFAEVAGSTAPQVTGPAPLETLRQRLHGSEASPRASARRRGRSRPHSVDDPLWLILGRALRGEASCHVVLALPTVGPRRETEQCLKLAGLLRRVRQRQRRRQVRAPRQVNSDSRTIEALRAEAHELRRQLALWDFRGEEWSPSAHPSPGRRKALQRVVDVRGLPGAGQGHPRTRPPNDAPVSPRGNRTGLRSCPSTQALSDREEELEKLQAPASEARRATLHLASLRRRLFAAAGAAPAPGSGLWGGEAQWWVAPAGSRIAAACVPQGCLVAWGTESTSEGSEGEVEGQGSEGEGEEKDEDRAGVQPSLAWHPFVLSSPERGRASTRAAGKGRGNSWIEEGPRGVASWAGTLTDSSTGAGSDSSPSSSSSRSRSSSASDWGRVLAAGSGSGDSRARWQELGGPGGEAGTADPRRRLHRRLARRGIPFLCNASADPTLNGALTYPLFVGDTRLAARRFSGLHVARGADEGGAAAATQFVEALPPSQVQVLLAGSLVVGKDTAASAQAPLRATPVLEGIGPPGAAVGAEDGATSEGWGREAEGGREAEAEEDPRCVVRHTQHQGSAEGAEDRMWNHLELVIAPGTEALATDAEGRVVWDARERRRDVPAACTLRSGAVLCAGAGAGILEVMAPADWADAGGGADPSLVNAEEKGVLEGAVAGLLIGELGDAGVHMGPCEGAEAAGADMPPAAEGGAALSDALRGASPAEAAGVPALAPSVSSPPPVEAHEPAAKGAALSAPPASRGTASVNGRDAEHLAVAPAKGLGAAPHAAAPPDEEAVPNEEGTVFDGADDADGAVPEEGVDALAAPLRRLVGAVGAELGLAEAEAGEVVHRARKSAVKDAATANGALRALRMPLRCEVVAMCPREARASLPALGRSAAFAEPPAVQCEEAGEDEDLGLFVALRLAELAPGPDSVCLVPLGEVPFSEFSSLARALAAEQGKVLDNLAQLGLPTLSRREGAARRCLLRGERDGRRILPLATAEQLPLRGDVAQRVVRCLQEVGVACEAEWAAREVEARALEAAEAEGTLVRVV